MRTVGKSLISNDFYCTECGNKGIPIMRRECRQRKTGHLKKLFCIYCNKETNHAEVQPYGNYTVENFKKEFELGRYVDGEKIPRRELPVCRKHNCPYNVTGQCWNTNNSYKCELR